MKKEIIEIAYKKMIDLTHNIIDFLPVYPGDEETRLYQTKYLTRLWINEKIL